MKTYGDTAVLLLAFGGAPDLESVAPFLKSVLAPCEVTEDQIEKAKQRYQVIGGKSPLLDITSNQAKALEELLSNNYPGLRVYVGMKHWHPFIRETLSKIAKDGIKKIIAVTMTSHNSRATIGGYIDAVQDALRKIDCHPGVDFIESWHDKEAFLSLLAHRIKAMLPEFSDRSNVYIIFSAHSLPVKMVENDPYVEQLKQTIDGVLKLTGPLNHVLAFQSKGGGGLQWLGPGVEEVLEELAQKDIKDVLLIPLGFVCDHVETLYDIDIVFKNKAAELGLNFKRTPSLNDSPDFIEFLAELISEELKGDK